MTPTKPQTKRQILFSLEGLSMQQRLPILICVLLLIVITVFSWISYTGVKKAAVQIGKERLLSLTEELSSIFGQSAQALTASTRLAANQDVFKNYLVQQGKISDTAAVAALKKLKSDSAWILVELLNLNRYPVLQSGSPEINTEVSLDSIISELSLGPDSCKIGKLYQLKDSIYYPVVSAVTENKQVIGYLVRWRLQFATQKSIAQFSQLLGANAQLYIGNIDGSLWSDLNKQVSSPPVDVKHLKDFSQYTRSDDNRVIASGRPVAYTQWLVFIEFSQQKVLETASRFLRWFIITGILLVIIAFFVAWILSRNITRPINKLIEVTSAIASGDYSQNLEIHRTDEIGKLASSFNIMVGQIRDSQQSLEKTVQERTSQLKTNIEQLKESELQFKGLLESAPDAMVIVNEEGKIILINQQTENLFGYSKEELINQNVELLIPGNFRNQHVKHRANYFKDPKLRSMGAGFELFALRKDGSQFAVEISLSPMKTSERLLVSAAIRDITERKKIEKQLIDSEEKYSKLFNSIDEGFCIIEMIFDEQKKPVDYRFLVINASFERQTGLSNAVGKRMREFAPDHEEHWFETYGKIALTGESIRFENRAEQLHRWYDVYAFRFGDPGDFQVAILFNDITERKKIEDQLQEAIKELEAFSYSVSHDLRAPLRIIDGYAEILTSDYKEKLDEEGNRVLGVITENARKMGKLIDDLLNLSRQGRKELVLHFVDMTRLVESVIAENDIPGIRNVNIRVNQLDPAYCDSSLIRQVWVNFVSNAVKYSVGTNKPVIEISSAKKDNEIIYSIKDNGVGFDMKYAEKLFGVFQRLHKATEYEGTGVGLALVQRIIIRHGGRVWAEAEKDKGATFYFSLPG